MRTMEAPTHAYATFTSAQYIMLRFCFCSMRMHVQTYGVWLIVYVN